LKNTVIYLCASITVIILISTINFFKYGKFLDEDFKSASFKDALTALYRVDDGIIEPYKPVSKIKRELVYNVSPSFAELKSYFEAGGLGWTKAGCDYKEYKYICDQQDYASGWFMWALRDAVASIGYYKSPMKADDFYLRVANEINNACNQGLINCRSQIMGIIPPTSKDQWANLLPTIYKGFEVLNFSYGMEIEIPSVGPIDKIKSINGFLGNPFVSPPLDTQEILVAGWINTTNREWPYIGCLSQDGKSYNKIELAHLPSQDLKDPNLLNNRFSIRIKEGIGRCYFYSNDGKQLLDINAHINKRGGYDLFPTFYLNLDEITKLNYDINNADPKFVNMKKLLVSFYSSFINYLCIIGFLSFVIIGIYSIFKSHKIDDLFILCFSLWISIFVRVFLLSLIEISSFKAIAHLYLGPAFPMIILASMLSIITLFNFFPYRGFLKISIHIKKKVNS
jgi:hypothetical protein